MRCGFIAAVLAALSAAAECSGAFRAALETNQIAKPNSSKQANSSKQIGLNI